jgi:hypothetical protein
MLLMMARPSSSLLQVLSAMFRYRFAAACPSDPRLPNIPIMTSLEALSTDLRWICGVHTVRRLFGTPSASNSGIHGTAGVNVWTSQTNKIAK